MAKKEKEPQIVIRPIGKLGGLDNIHVALIVLVSILLILVVVISYSKLQVIPNQTNCTIQTPNSTSIANASSPIHSVAEVINYTERVIASYNYINTNSSLGVYLPFYSNTLSFNASYMPSSKEWFVSVPVQDPLSNSTFDASFVIYDSNLTLARAFIQTFSPRRVLNYKAIYLGVLNIPNKFACVQKNPVNIFWFIDPYAPGSIYSLEYIPKLQHEFGNNVNISIKILFGPYTNIFSSKYGATNAELLGKYLLCASQQSNFTNFIINLNAIYSNNYISNQTLYSIAKISRLNMSLLDSCIINSSNLINVQTMLAEYYNITSTPSVVVNCKYLTLPETVSNGVCVSNSTLCK
ncbi:MAG: DsbA family protein [Candidatus Micrarchaeia archaeon]